MSNPLTAICVTYMKAVAAGLHARLEMMTARPLALSLSLLFATALAGLAIRFAHLGLPLCIVKYGGSMLWALMIYWVVSSLLPLWRMISVALLAGLVATAVEVFKLYHSPALDEFRLTLPGILLLGRIFSGWDIVAYWLVICAGASVDSRIRLVERRSYR
jgi:hypothetical protein